MTSDAHRDDAAEIRICPACDRPWMLMRGEQRFEKANPGIAPYRHCRLHRPMRRAALAQGGGSEPQSRTDSGTVLGG